MFVTTRGIDLRSGELQGRLGRETARGEQVHGARVAIVDGPGTVPGVDGVATRGRVAVLALGADCPGVAVVGNASVAVAHSGWRGTVADIGVRAVEVVRGFGDRTEDLRAYVGPGIGICCFEVGDEVVAEFERAFGNLDGLVTRKKKAHIDLKGAIARRLVLAGLKPENVLVAPECTFCEREKFFSRRREGPGSGHHAVVAMLR